jgi:hypothetical protein
MLVQVDVRRKYGNRQCYNTPGGNARSLRNQQQGFQQNFTATAQKDKFAEPGKVRPHNLEEETGTRKMLRPGHEHED